MTSSNEVELSKMTSPVETNEPNGINENSKLNEEISISIGENANVEISLPNQPSFQRSAWANKLEFILTCIGFAVGLGNVWRFPYLCYKHGGGAFLFPYFIMLAFIGLPIFFLELAIGQFASCGPISVWSVSPLFQGVGYTAVMVSLVIQCYYAYILAQIVVFLVESFRSTLPWATCTNSWNTANCYVTTGNSTAARSNISKPVPSPEEYHNIHVMRLSDSINNFGLPYIYTVGTLFLVWVIVAIVLFKGIKTLGKVAYFTAIFPYIMLMILLVRGFMMPGAMKGIKYYVIPNFSKLLNIDAWVDAANQIFFSLSCCNGGLIAMSSFNKFKNNCCRDSVIVSQINCATSLFAGFVTFSYLGYMADSKGTTIDAVAQKGPDLVFKIYPEALATMPVSPMWSVFFFLMLLTLGFGSLFSITETVCSGFIDIFTSVGLFTAKYHDYGFRISVFVFSFLVGIPMTCPGGFYLFDIMDAAINKYPMLVVALFEIIIICYFYGYSQFERDIGLMMDNKPGIYWKITLCGTAPVLITILIGISCFISTASNYPSWTNGITYFVYFLTLISLPVVFFYKYCTNGGWLVLTEFLKPDPNWGPADTANKTEFIRSILNVDNQPDDFFQSKQNLARDMTIAAERQLNTLKPEASPRLQ